MHLGRKVLTIDGEQIACEFVIRATTAVMLHGAGTAHRKRLYNLAQAFLNHGVGVVLFDFSGHGESSGELKELSLARRQLQAQEVIEQLVPSGGQLYFVGFSMGGQTLCDILPRYQERTSGILLCCPAMYSNAAHSLQFGNPEFTKIIRTPGSWATSTAPAHLAAYPGRIIIAMGTEDKVIPPEVVTLYKKAVPQSIYIEYRGLDHKLSTMFASNPSAANEVVSELTQA